MTITTHYAIERADRTERPRDSIYAPIGVRIGVHVLESTEREAIMQLLKIARNIGTIREKTYNNWVDNDDVTLPFVVAVLNQMNTSKCFRWAIHELDDGSFQVDYD